jgi:hypothetical protein
MVTITIIVTINFIIIIIIMFIIIIILYYYRYYINSIVILPKILGIANPTNWVRIQMVQLVIDGFG